MFEIHFFDIETPDIHSFTFFTACMFAMHFSEHYGRTCVLSSETGEILREYNNGFVTYDTGREE